MRFSMSLLGKLKNVFGLLALIIISLLIWFVLPAITMGGGDPFGSAMTRALMITSMLGMTFIYKLRSSLSQKRKNEQMASEMANVGAKEKEKVIGESEIAELRNKFEDALGLLKKVKTSEGGRGSYLYVLPWYVIIGPSGSGKTTALLNSDLHFPLLDSVGASVKGVGGTRNCDWWFTDEAVLLDTAGRYTTQNNQNEIDEVEWKGFLSLLKKFRSRKPINGLIIAFSIDNLLKMQESDLITHAKFIKQRIHEFQETFKIRFPVYVTFTKCDLLPGFTEFFENFGREERAQVWGMTFPYNDDESQDVVPSFISEFRMLQERIQSREAERLQVETDINRRELIYVFPRTIGLLQDPIAIFLREIFKPTRFETQPLLRGVYLTSGTQDGTTLDRLINSLGAKFGLSAESAGRRGGKGKAYFLHNLLTKVIFKESALAGTNIKHERRLFAFHMSVYGVAFLLALGLSSYWAYAYTENKSLIEHVANKTKNAEIVLENISRYEENILEPVEALNLVRDIPTGYNDQQHTSYKSFYQMGLYQGDKLGQEASNAYRNLLHKSFLPRLLARIEAAIHENRHLPDDLYDTLRVYLMLGDSSRLKKEVVMNWFREDWKKTLPSTVRKSEYENLEQHLVALLEFLPEMAAFQPNEELVNSARTVLSKEPPSRRFYFRLKQEGLINESLNPFRLVDAVGSESAFIFNFKNGQKLTTGINGFYTRQGYQFYFIDQRKEMVESHLTDEWVMGEEYGLQSVGLSKEMLHTQVEELYLADYLSAWRSYLENIDFKPVNTARESLLLLKDLSKNDSPIVALIKGIAEHTSADAFSIYIEEKKTESEKSIASDVFQAFTTNADESSLESFEAITNPVVIYFSDLNDMLESDDDRAPPIEDTLKLLDELYVYMSAIDGALNRGKTAFQTTADPQGSAAVLKNMDIEASRFPKPLSSFLQRVTNNARVLTTLDAKSYMQRQWTNEVTRHCNNMIKGRYPFNKRSRREATLDDMSAYFGPGGILESYYNDVVVDYIDTTRRPWKWNSNNGVSLGFSSTVLKQMEIGRVVRDTFYRTGSAQPAISFELKPLQMDKSILRMSLSINGQQMAYAHGPQRGKRFTWPGYGENADRGLARLVIVTSTGQESITEQGDWSLFKLFDQAQIKRLDKERYTLTFKLKNSYVVSLELRAGSVYNPFQMAELSQVGCE